MLPSFLSRIFRVPAKQEDVTPAQAGREEVSTAKADALTTNLWVDDTALRGLADDANKEITNWVVAHDLKELFSHIDLYNNGKSAEDQIHVSVLSSESEKISEWRKADFHNPNKNDIYSTKGPLVLKGETLLKAFGPGTIDGLGLRVGENEALPMRYVHTGLETYVVIEEDGNARTIYFKGVEAGGCFRDMEPRLNRF